MNRTTQRFVHSSLALILLLAIAGCSGREPSYPEQSNTTPTALDITDLKEILSTLDASNATLTYYNGENEETYPANAAIRAEKYITELQNYDMWEICQPPEHWSSNGDCHYSFNGDGVSLTAYRNGFEGVRPLHVTTSIGDNWFRLADSTLAQTDSTQQLSWMLCGTFGNWYNEAQAATLNRSTGTPLAADELDEFEAFTSSQVSTYVEEWGGYVVSSTPISCFFTSLYDDPRNLDANAFITYCPSQEELGPEDEAEFQLVQKKLDWRNTSSHLLTLEEMPVPCHRLPRSYINKILMQYAGITMEDMQSDWRAELCYVPETDCFYTTTSDFGPGVFNLSYGEKSGNIVTLWGASSYSGGTAVLTLQKSNNSWLIQSFQAK